MNIEELKLTTKSHYEHDTCLTIEKVEKAGFKVIYREPWQLLVDLDKTCLSQFQDRLKSLSGFWPVAGCTYWQSKTQFHHHAVVELKPQKVELTPQAVIALQLALGSDPVRELVALSHDIPDGSTLYSILFQPANAVLPEIKL